MRGIFTRKLTQNEKGIEAGRSFVLFNLLYTRPKAAANSLMLKEVGSQTEDKSRLISIESHVVSNFCAQTHPILIYRNNNMDICLNFPLEQ